MTGPVSLRRAVTVSVSLYCRCGSACETQSTPGGPAMGEAREWSNRHRGPGHGNATSREAAAVRRMQQMANVQNWEAVQSTRETACSDVWEAGRP